MSRSLRLRRGWRHPTEFRPTKSKPVSQPVFLYRAKGSPRVGRAFRMPGRSGRWLALVSKRDAVGIGEHELLPGWFKSRKTAVAAVLRAAEARKAGRP